MKLFFEAVKLENRRLKIGAIDFGTKHIGIAVSDETRNFAFPLVSFERKQPRMSEGSLKLLLRELENICATHKIGAFLIGFPVHPTNNELTPLCSEILTLLSQAPTLSPAVIIIG